VEYHPPSAADDPAIQALTRAAMEVMTGDELASIEAQLIPLWGDRFMNAAAILDVRDTEINVHLRLRAIGRIDEVVDFDDAKASDSEAIKQARANAQIASCMNNMKQLALVMRLFENEQAASLWPAGWRMTYPNYMADTRILTCPGDEAGTESYELLFPGPNTEWLLALGRQLEGLREDAPEGQVSGLVPVAVEKHHCSGLDGRNVVYMDGHVERVTDAAWDAAIAPYLEYR
jgi:prepilin-type processing-associated H-X9-DG protein